MKETKRMKSHEKAEKRAEWFMHKFLLKLREGKDEAHEFYRKKASVLRSRNTKYFFWELAFEMEQLFLGLWRDAGTYYFFNQGKKYWLEQRLEFHYGHRN